MNVHYHYHRLLSHAFYPSSRETVILSNNNNNNTRTRFFRKVFIIYIIRHVRRTRETRRHVGRNEFCRRKRKTEVKHDKSARAVSLPDNRFSEPLQRHTRTRSTGARK